MVIYVGMDIYCVSLFEMEINLNHFSVILYISLHMNVCVTDIHRMNDLIQILQFYISYCDRHIPSLNPVTYRSAYELSSTTKHWRYTCKEYVHSKQIWINFNTSTHEITETYIHKKLTGFSIIMVPWIHVEKILWFYYLKYAWLEPRIYLYVY